MGGSFARENCITVPQDHERGLLRCATALTVLSGSRHEYTEQPVFLSLVLILKERAVGGRRVSEDGALMNFRLVWVGSDDEGDGDEAALVRRENC
jgi:hypothetical protein